MPSADALAPSVRLSELAQTGRSDRERPGQQVIEQYTDAVHVAPDRGLGSGEQLRCEIERCAGQSRGRRVAELEASPKVHEDDSAILSEHHVLRFDVAMEQTGGMHGGNGGTELNADRERLGRAEGLPLLDGLREREALDELHPQTDLIADALGAVDSDDVGMAHTCQQPALFDNRRRARRLARRCSGQDLQRDLAIESGVPGAVHLAKGTAPDSLEHP